MENKSDHREERFDSYLNKTIFFLSKYYFRKQMNIFNNEKNIIDDENYSKMLDEFIALNDSISNINTSTKLTDALKSLSAIEQSVIFLLYHEELSQEEAAKMLEIYSKSVSRIKIRAIKKLKEYLKGEDINE